MVSLDKLLAENYSEVKNADENILKIDTKKINRIMQLYEEFLKFLKNDTFYNPDDRSEIRKYIEEEFLSKTFSTVLYTKEDITECSLSIGKYQEESPFTSSGIFLSSLIRFHHERTKEEEYLLITEDFGSSLDYVCCGLDGGTVTIKGSVGTNAGEEMLNGTIIIEGEAYFSCGIRMLGGKIHIKKDTGSMLGAYMEGGIIFAEGNTGDRAGFAMSNGNIIIQGNTGIDLVKLMSGGTMIVNGSTGEFACDHMFDGNVLIRGNIGDRSCTGMGGGVVYVEGNAKNIAQFSQGGTIHLFGKKEPDLTIADGTTEIYYNGKKIFPKGDI